VLEIDWKTDALEANMRAWREKLQAMAMAVAFAEAGEWETAQSLTRNTFARRNLRPVKTQKRTDERAKKQLYRT
jgi:hypothetical protein